MKKDMTSRFNSSAVRNFTLWAEIGTEIGVTTKQAEEKWRYLLRKYREALDNMGGRQSGMLVLFLFKKSQMFTFLHFKVVVSYFTKN